MTPEEPVDSLMRLADQVAAAHTRWRRHHHLHRALDRACCTWVDKRRRRARDRFRAALAAEAGASSGVDATLRALDAYASEATRARLMPHSPGTLQRCDRERELLRLELSLALTALVPPLPLPRQRALGLAPWSRRVRR